MDSAASQLNSQITHLKQQIADSIEMAKSDPSLKELTDQELSNLESQIQALETSLQVMSGSYQSNTPDNQDFSMDGANAIIEIRGGAGGDEAKLFAEDLMRMYMGYAEIKKIKMEPLDDGVIKMIGRNAYGQFKYESGVHRVQRVPSTESSGRIHTSTASVAVLPEVAASQVEIREEDLLWKFTRAGGHGGQNVNKVSTAVMLTHVPSGIVVHCRQERRQQQNRILALELLRSQLWEIEEEKRLSGITSKRKAAVGRAMRAEKIRTFNYPENRVTDHRIKKTWYSLDRIIQGDLENVIKALQDAEAETEDQSILT